MTTSHSMTFARDSVSQYLKSTSLLLMDTWVVHVRCRPNMFFMSFLLSLNWIERIWGNLLTERFIRLEFGRNTIVIYCQNVQKHSTCLSDASLKYVSVARFNLRCDFIWITKKAISLNMREEGYTPKRSSAKKSFCEHVCEQFVETCVTASVAAIQVHHILPIVSCIFQR